MVENVREKEALKLIETAHKKIKGSFFSNIFNSQSSRYEEALDLFEKAGNMFKLSKNWEKAGESFEKCGEIEEKLDSDAASHYLEASHCFSFVDQKSLIQANFRVFRHS
jgi:alpha-soluble NSF attachment protein